MIVSVKTRKRVLRHRGNTITDLCSPFLSVINLAAKSERKREHREKGHRFSRERRRVLQCLKPLLKSPQTKRRELQ